MFCASGWLCSELVALPGHLLYDFLYYFDENYDCYHYGNCSKTLYASSTRMGHFHQNLHQNGILVWFIGEMYIIDNKSKLF